MFPDDEQVAAPEAGLSEAAATVLEAATSLRWASDVEVLPSPTFHLDLTIAELDMPVYLAVHIVSARPTFADCGPNQCAAAITGRLQLPFGRLLILMDEDVPEPFGDLMSPPAHAEMPFEALMFLGGLALEWAEPLRRSAKQEDVRLLRRGGLLT